MTQFLRMHEIIARVPFSRTHIYRLIARGEFPQNVKVGARRVAWIETEVDAWLAVRVAQRDAPSEPKPDAAPVALRRKGRPVTPPS
jgi:prophage regulatory protein